MNDKNDALEVIGPDDVLLLVTHTAITAADAQRIKDRIPKRLHGRVFVVDGTTVDTKVVRGDAA